MYLSESNSKYIGPWDEGESETLVEFLGNWIGNGRPNVGYHFMHMGNPVVWPETDADYLIEKLAQSGNSYDLGVGFDAYVFMYNGVKYVAYVAYGDQNICDIETKDNWNSRISAMLIP